MGGVRVVTRTWVDPEFKKRLLKDGVAACLDSPLLPYRHINHFEILLLNISVMNSFYKNLDAEEKQRYKKRSLSLKSFL
ncbi:nitrile hydratase subunit alpha [Legionella longbeachae]|uniref:nitrile hydratase subunit alpha n=1 Tax=Legionella longbeachae TaxID=450 RepID=UPI0002E32501|nr:nitrile hydratase subunit alpha [Legionella longbeachae]VEE02796.1 Thiocyanate hydrolase subunit gamma [Legionella oakridgensis]